VFIYVVCVKILYKFMYQVEIWSVNHLLIYVNYRYIISLYISDIRSMMVATL